MPIGTPLRNVRIPDELWDAALARAQEEGRTVSEVMRDHLAHWVARPIKPSP